MGAAFEVNKQMCDIGRLISVEEMAERYNKQILQSRLDGLSAWLKLQDMEEKKTKKMTKAEAFEYLKATKVLCKSRSEEIQRLLISVGFKWTDANDEILLVQALFLHKDGKMGYVTSLAYFLEHSYAELSEDDILSIEIVEDTKPDCERNEHVKALQELIAKSGCIDCIIISKNDIGILKK